ncbi:hypothetical protein HYW53_03645 [Candidatus Giovannonibacteria bacterium]|nr:hypothetical protein [Candidatus Giovannonibacteria bacterium]
MQRDPFKSFSGGYSLFELVVYSGILAIIAVLAVGSLLSIYKVYLRTSVERSLSAEGDVALETMVREIRAANVTDTGVSVFGASPGILKVGDKKFSLSSGTLQVQNGANPPDDLTADTRVTNLKFYRMISSGAINSEIIKVEFTLEAGSGAYLRTKNFYGSAVLRGMY